MAIHKPINIPAGMPEGLPLSTIQPKTEIISIELSGVSEDGVLIGHLNPDVKIIIFIITYTAGISKGHMWFATDGTKYWGIWRDYGNMFLFTAPSIGVRPSISQVQAVIAKLAEG